MDNGFSYFDSQRNIQYIIYITNIIEYWQFDVHDKDKVMPNQHMTNKLRNFAN